MVEENRKVTIKGFPTEKSNPYTLRGVYYSLVSSPKDGREQCTRFLSCRDYIHEIVRAHVQKNGRLSCYYTPDENPPIDMERLRLLIANDYDYEEAKDFKKKLFNAKKIINFYEEIANWGRSKITTVTHEIKKNAWLLTGPKEWMSYPNLLSMVTLILRIGIKYGPIEFKDNKTLEEMYKGIIDKHDKKGAGYEYHDISYLKQCYKRFYLIAKHHKILFTLPLEEAYPPNGSGNDFHPQGGIVEMCKFRAADEGLNVRFKELLMSQK